MNCHASPSTANIEQPHPGHEPQLATNQVIFDGLCFVETRVAGVEVSARVGHRLSEDQPVEIVADVVMMCDRRCITILGVDTTTDAGLFGWRCRGKAENPKFAGCPDQCWNVSSTKFLTDHVGRIPRHVLSRRKGLDDGTLEIDLSGHIRSAKAKLTRCPQDVTEGLRRFDHDYVRSRCAQKGTIPKLDGHRSRIVQERGHQRFHDLSDCFCHRHIAKTRNLGS